MILGITEQHQAHMSPARISGDEHLCHPRHLNTRVCQLMDDEFFEFFPECFGHSL
jgi:hypothetical protein